MSSQFEQEVEHKILELLKDKETFIRELKALKNPDIAAKISLLKFTIYNSHEDEKRNVEKVKRLLQNASKENNNKAYRMAAIIIVLNMLENLEVMENDKQEDSKEISTDKDI